MTSAPETLDSKAFHTFSYGLYVVSAASGGRGVGCIVNTLHQVTSRPARVSVAINKENFTAGAVIESGRFEATVLAESAPMELIGRFGFNTSADLDKFADTEHAKDAQGVPYVTEHAVAHVGARVVETVDVGSHYLIVGEVDVAEVLSDEPPMTYAYYHLVKGGKTPPKASSYDPAGESAGEGEAAPAAAGESAETAPAAADAPTAGARIGWRCRICGYVVEADELPEDFTCPMCGMGRDMFERIEL